MLRKVLIVVSEK